ncbi:NAD(P)-binding domain-containing protein [Elongatibacter sediminis]|uniref:NAD(P)-binding domain-containing protein n=1 Tax=Elongatibacter sediminis TaxID=3119006 RepID=A0AAW9R6L5_9GAMM
MSDAIDRTKRNLLRSSLAAGGGLVLPGLGAAGIANLLADAGNTLSTDLLIVGAGPFGLALAAYAQEHGIHHQVVGVPMGFWREHMPEGMLLRSTCDWSLDPLGIHTIDAYLTTLGRRCRDVEPLSRGFYLDYARWFQEQKAIYSRQTTITQLLRDGADLIALTDTGQRIRSRNVVLALGFGNFAYTPPELAPLFPADRYGHTCDRVDFGQLRDRRVLIIGGRQSAFEWTALIREAGAAAVHVAYRHDTPLFETSEWGWVNDIVDRLSTDPAWYRRLTDSEKADLNRRFWEEGRLKLEPWLADRIDHPNVHLHPHTNVRDTHDGDGGIRVTLDNEEVLTVDEVVFATGYRVDLQRVPLLTEGLLSELNIRDGFPQLDPGFQTQVPGLYITSLAATRDFGSFLAFTVSVRAQAQIIGEAIRARLATTALPGPSLLPRNPAVA